MLCAKFGWYCNSYSVEDFYISSMYFCNYGIISFFKRVWSFFSTNLYFLHQRHFVPGLVEIDPVVLERRIFKFRYCIFAISLLSSIRKGRCPSFEQTWNSVYPRMLCAKFCWYWPSWFWVDLKFRQCIFAISVIFSIGKKNPIETNMNSPHSGMLSAKSRWNWHCDSEEDF